MDWLEVAVSQRWEVADDLCRTDGRRAVDVNLEMVVARFAGLEVEDHLVEEVGELVVVERLDAVVVDSPAVVGRLLVGGDSELARLDIHIQRWWRCRMASP
ncbi:MAG: hypothetical protein [Cressdnaviricota sp.]|nr:MAG: hypothetical protein [Cressdnaviricota sp.]